MERRPYGSIRPYIESDLHDVLDVWYRASLLSHAFLPAEFFERERKHIAERWMPIAETTVYDTGRVVGFMSLIGNEVGGIFVDPDSQGTGVGRALMDAASTSRPFLELNVLERNAIGRKFYDAYGFEQQDRHWNEDAGEFELRLRSTQVAVATTGRDRGHCAAVQLHADGAAYAWGVTARSSARNHPSAPTRWWASSRGRYWS